MKRAILGLLLLVERFLNGCGGAPPDVGGTFAKVLHSYNTACPKGLDTPDCVYAAQALESAAEAVKEAHADPSQSKLFDAVVAVEKAGYAVQLLKH